MALIPAHRKHLQHNKTGDRPICVICNNTKPLGTLWLTIPLLDSATGTLETCAWPCAKLALLRGGAYLNIDWDGLIRMIPEKRHSILEIRKECAS